MGKMKIFDWVHRKFHTNVDYCMVSRKKEYAWVEEELGVKKTEDVEKDTDALLPDHVALIKAFNGWPEGIFAIGTFGIDHPDHLYHDEYSDDGEDVFPVEKSGAAAADEAVIQKNEDALIAAVATADNAKPTGAGDEEKASGGESIIVETGPPEYYYVTLTEEEEKKKKKGERTTLADLFSAEAAHLPPAPPAADPLKPPPVLPGEGLPARRKKHVGSFAKKLIMPWKGEDSRPTTKIHRLLTKMMKRKIHPEIYSNINGAHEASVPEENPETELPTFGSSSSSSYNSIAHVAQNESASLLQAVANL